MIRGDDDESSGRRYAAGFDCVRRLLAAAGHSQTRMLASNGMRPARQLRASPLTAALALALLFAATLFFAHDPGGSPLAWLGVGGAPARWACCSRPRAPPGGLVALAPLARASRSGAPLSIAWSHEPDRSWNYANRTFVYLAFALLGAFLGDAAAPAALRLLDPARRRVRLVARSARCCPWLYEDYGRIARLRSPVGYWNALALLGDIALPIGLCLATRRRTAGTLLVFGWIVVIGLTYSRGGVLVAIVVVALWMLLSHAWIEALSTLVAAGLPAAGALAVAFALDGHHRATGRRTPRASTPGVVFGIVLAVDALIAVGLSRFPLPQVTAVTAARARRCSRSCSAPLSASARRTRTRGGARSRRSSGTELTNSPSRLASSGGNFR